MPRGKYYRHHQRSRGERRLNQCRRDFRIEITDPLSIETALAEHTPSVVINAAAYTAVDKAESERGTAFAVNSSGPEALASACARRGAPLVHISTDYVFDGHASEPYRESDVVRPINAYGLSKAAGEAAVRLRHPAHVILRTAWVYSSHGHNFVKTILRLAREGGGTLRVVADQLGTPTSAVEIAAALIVIASHLASADPIARHTYYGTFHFTAAGETTWHGFAEHILCYYANVTGQRTVLEAIATADYPTPAQRPANSRLECSRIEEVFGISRGPWQEGVDHVLDDLLGSRTGCAFERRVEMK